MPERGEGGNGTTILIPWPDLPTDGAGERIADILLHNLWPKLVSKSGPKAMHIGVEEEGEPIPVADPLRHPVYNLFSSALLTARTRDPAKGAEEMKVRRTRVTGNLAFAEAVRRPVLDNSVDLEERPERTFDGPIRHVALMRPSELVVRYVELSGMREETEWTGVFLCSEEPAVLRAFASAEPPAHDDWVPDRLSGPEATLVRVTVRKRIPEAVRQRFGVPSVDGTVSDGMDASLAAAADRFSERFIAGDGSAPGDSGGGGGGGGGSGPVIRTPVFSRLRAEGGRRIAEFKIPVAGATDVKVRGVVAVEGADNESLPAGMRPPDILGWVTPAGERVPGAICPLDQTGNFLMEVEFGGDYAIVARCEPVEE